MSEVISFINEKGGVGKSTSAITIAQILAISGYNVLLIDLDPQMNTTKMFGQTDEVLDINYEHLFCTKQLRKSSVLEFISSTDYKTFPYYQLPENCQRSYTPFMTGAKKQGAPI